MIEQASKLDIVLALGLILLGMILLANYSRLQEQNTQYDKTYQQSSNNALTELKTYKLEVL